MSSSFRSWLLSLRRTNRHQRRVSGHVNSMTGRYRPRLETLEDRTVPAKLVQITSVDPNFQAAIADFRAGLGGVQITDLSIRNNATGYRELFWEEVGGGSLNPFPGGYFNTTVRNGIVFSTDPGDLLQVSGNANSATERFKNVNASYLSTLPQPFSGDRLFAPIGSTTTNLEFRDPNNTGAQATVKGFGLIFSDVDRAGTSSIKVMDSAGNPLTVNGDNTGIIYAPVQNGGLTFVGVIFTDGERIGRVEVTNGNLPLSAAPTGDETAINDIVAMDNMIYSQPQPLATPVFKWANNADGNWSDAVNWTLTSGTLPMGHAAYPSAAGDIAVFGSNLTGSRTITVPDISAHLSALQVDNAASLTFTATGTGKFILEAVGNPNGGVALDITNNNNGNAAVAINSPVELRDYWEVTTLGSSQLTLAGSLTEQGGNRAVIKHGPGTMNLASLPMGQTHTFNGPLTSNAGTVHLDSVLSNSAIELFGSTLSGTGSFKGLTASSSNYVIDPGQGATPGTLSSTASSLWDSNATFQARVQGTAAGQFDQFAVTGNLTLNNASLSLNIDPLALDVGQSVDLITTTGSISGQFIQGTSFVNGTKIYQLSYAGGAVTLTNVSTATTTTVTRTPNQNTVFGQQIQFNATVASQAIQPLGQARFELFLNNVLVETVLASLTGATATTATAMLSRSTLDQGDYSVNVTYVPSTVHTASSSSVAHVINPTDVDIDLTTSDSSAFYSTPVITAQVQAANNAQIPSGGSVTFFANGQNVGSANIDANGEAILPATLNVGDYTIRASFTSADNNFNNGGIGVSNQLTQEINPVTTTTALTSNPAAWAALQDIQFTATVTPSVAGLVPAGRVDFYRLANPTNVLLGQANLVGNQASITAQLPVGSQSVRAIYVPEAPPGNFAASQVTVNQNVNQAQVNIALAPASTTVVFGQAFTLTTTISSSVNGGPTPVGDVIFTLNSGPNSFPSAPITLVNGQASVNSADLGNLPAGNYHVQVQYLGEPLFQNKTTNFPNAVTISRADVTVTLNSAAAVCGQLISSTATVNAVAPGMGNPTGQVRFTLSQGGMTIQQVLLPVQNVNGNFQATFSRNDLITGAYDLTAEYLNQGGNFNNATSASATLTVTPAAVAFLLVPNPTSQYADPVTFVATVSSALLPSGVAVAGNVRFQISNDVNVYDMPVINGQAVFTPPPNLPGTYQISAEYLGDGCYLPAPLQTITHIITPATTIATAVLQSPAGTPVFGQRLTFRASIQANNPNAGIPAGTVSFLITPADGTAQINSGPIILNPDGTADFSPVEVLAPTVGRSPVTVQVFYLGNDPLNRFLPSNNSAAPLQQTIQRADTTVALQVVRRSDQATTGFLYADTLELRAQVATTGLDADAAARAGVPVGTVQFFYVNGGTELSLGNAVTLDNQGNGTFITARIGNQNVPIRLPGGLHNLRARYEDSRAYDLFNPSFDPQSPNVLPIDVVASNLAVKSKSTGRSSPNNRYAYGQSLVFTVQFRFVTPVVSGKLIQALPNGTLTLQDVQTAPTGTGQFQFFLGGVKVLETGNLPLLTPPNTAQNIRALAPAQPYRYITFTSSALFSNQIANRNQGVNHANLLGQGIYTIFAKYNSNAPQNFNSLTSDAFASAFEITRSALGRRW